MVLHSAHRCLSICALLCKRERVFTNKVMRFWATKSRAFYNIPINTLAINRTLSISLYFFVVDILYFPKSMIFPSFQSRMTCPVQGGKPCLRSKIPGGVYISLKSQESKMPGKGGYISPQSPGFGNVSAFQFLSIEQDKVNCKHRMANSLKWLPFGKMKNKFRLFKK